MLERRSTGGWNRESYDIPRVLHERSFVKERDQQGGGPGNHQEEDNPNAGVSPSHTELPPACWMGEGYATSKLLHGKNAGRRMG